MTEQMFGRVPLNLVVTAIKDGTHGTHARVDNGIPFLSAKNITDSGEVSWNETDDRISDSEYEQIHRVFQLQPRDLLLTIVGSLGRRAVFDGARVTFQRSVAYVRPDRRRVSERFLFHWFAHGEFQRELVRRSNSTAQAGLYLGELAQTLVPDCPLTEQIKIAEVLDTLDTTIRQTEAIIDKLKQVKQGLLHDLLTRGIDDNGELRPSQSEAPHLYKESALGPIPQAWCVELLDEVAIRGSGHTPSKDVKSYWNGGIRWVSLADSHRLDRIYIDTTDKEISELGIANSSAVKHPAGTVVLSRDAGVGKSAILASEMAVSQHFMAWDCGDRLNNRYLYFKLQHMKPAFEAIALGSTVKTIGLDYFKKLRVAVPGRPEQGVVAAIMMDAEQTIRRHLVELGKLRELKSGLMDDLLTGRVRVTSLLNAET